MNIVTVEIRVYAVVVSPTGVDEEQAAAMAVAKIEDALNAALPSGNPRGDTVSLVSVGSGLTARTPTT